MPPLTQEDRAIRSTGIGSSDIAAIVGVSPYRTAHDVYLDKRGLLAPEPESLPMRIGHLVEQLIADLYCEETGERVEKSGTLRHPELPWFVGTPDRLVVGRKRLVEIKWVGWRAAKLWEQTEDGVPDFVRCQAEWLMALTGADDCHVPAILGGEEFRIYEVKRNAALAERLRSIGERFWRENVLAGNPPPADESESARRMLTTLFPEDIGPMKAAPPEARDWVERRAAAALAKKAAEKEHDLASNKLREMIGEAAGIVGDFGNVTWKQRKDGVRALKVWERKAERAA